MLPSQYCASFAGDAECLALQKELLQLQCRHMDGELEAQKWQLRHTQLQVLHLEHTLHL